MYKPYDRYKECGLLWVEKIPNDWQVNRIQDLLVQRKERNLPIKTTQILSLYASKGVVPYKDKGQAGNKAKDDLTLYNLAYPNDLIVNCMNVVAGSVGLSKYFGAISPVYYALYNRNESLNILFCNYVFQLEPFQKSLLGLGNGILMHKTEEGKLHTVRMRIPMQKLKNVQLPLPSISEQEKIAKFLDWKLSKINKYIKSKKKMISLLKEQKQAIINQAVTNGLDPTVQMKPSGIDWLGDIPAHWKVQRLKTHVKNATAISLNDKVEIYLGLENIESWTGRILSHSNASDFESQSKFFTSGCILFGKLRPNLAKVTIPNFSGSCSGEFLVLKNDNHYINEYLEILFRSYSFIDLVIKSTYGAKMPRAEWNFIGSVSIPFLSINEQIEIVKKVKDELAIIDIILDKTEKQIIFMNEYRTALISNAVTGKIDVRDIDVPEYEIEDENLVHEIEELSEDEITDNEEE